MKALAVIPCGKSKIWDKFPDHGPARADEAYTSPLHRLARSYAEKWADHYIVLSALHGFLEPSDIVPRAYDVSFNDPHDSRCITVKTLIDQKKQKRLNRFDKIVVLAPRAYADRVLFAFEGDDLEIILALKGKNLFTMMSFLKAARRPGWK